MFCTMAKIAGIGIYLPRYRIEAAEINRAWGRSGGKGRKSVAASDEDALTMGLEAAKEALASSGISQGKIGLISFASISSGYSEYALAAQVAEALGAERSVQVSDFGLSTRAVAAAMQASADAVSTKRIDSALVIASDKLIAAPGSSYELNYGAGAGALIFAERGFAEIEGMASHTSGFVGLSRREGAFHGVIDERFVMQHGYLDQAERAVMRLQENLKISEWDHGVFQAPDERWALRLLKILKFSSEKLQTSAAAIGYSGCASLLTHLALAFEEAKPGQRILALSYGPGGTDAFSICITEKPKFLTSIRERLAMGEAVSYAQYLRMNKLLRGGA